LIFKDKLKEKQNLLRPEYDKLIDIAWKNQSHSGDLLLWYVNGFYYEHAKNKLNPHAIGPGHVGHSEQAHYKFIHQYRTTYLFKVNYHEYLKELEWMPEKLQKIKELIEFEETTIQLEMLIYLKFREADLIIKNFYQFVRILHGEHYDWYFKIAASARDKNNTGTRQNLIRKKIRDKIKNVSPIICDLIKNSYKTQIRNSIAHSNYSFLGRQIHLNNYIENDPHSQIKTISFDEWIDIFHNTLVLYNEYIRMKNIIHKKYADIAIENGNTINIQITEKKGTWYTLPLKYRKECNDWRYKQNE